SARQAPSGLRDRACRTARADEISAGAGAVIRTEAGIPRFRPFDAEIAVRVRLEPLAVVLAIALELNVPGTCAGPHASPHQHAAPALVDHDREPVGAERGLRLPVREAETRLEAGVALR